MQAEITLQYGGILVGIVETYDSMHEAELHWSYGKAGCDCERSKYLKAAGVVDEIFACSDDGENVVKVFSIKPFYVH